MNAYPLLHAALEARPDGRTVLEHLRELEARFGRGPLVTVEASGGPDGGSRCDYDVALAGGGLSLFYGAYLARAGLRVVIFDRRRIGHGHREWNISRRELAPLFHSGLFTEAEVEELIELEYRTGIVRWHGGGTYPVRHVLDCVISAEKLLLTLRMRAESAGALLLDHHALAGYAFGGGGVRLRLESQGSVRELSTRLLLDGMGAESPHAAFDLVCPTVGGVLADLEEGEDPGAVDHTVGEILVTTEDIEEGRQHIWEGFPTRHRRFTTYLFYYTEPSRLPSAPLQSLYERFFTVRPRYKRGPARLEKATYGFIPAYSRLRQIPTAPFDRVLLVGDAAGRHSPLTFCGFGSMIRSFWPVADAILDRLARDRLDRRALASAWREPAGIAVMGGLTLMMVGGRGTRTRAASDVNRLLDAAFASLADLGEETFGAFVRDEIGFADFLSFMRKTAARRPSIYDEVFAVLSKRELSRWSLRLAALGLKKWSSGA